MAILVTGAAGFVGYHMARALLERGYAVIGVDNLNSYYSVALKQARLSRLSSPPAFQFHHMDIANHGRFRGILSKSKADIVIHLAAQAGVRHSVTAPFDYVHSNLVGHASVLEACRHEGVEHLVYASSSSVYGGLDQVAFAESHNTDRPVSLYAATKKADEALSHSYAHMYGLKQTGLRFFTAYGPWGRPDMAYWKFTEAILNDAPLSLFDGGQLWRDFTYIDDVVSGVLSAMSWSDHDADEAPHRIFNLGNNQPIQIRFMVQLLEKILQRKARIEFQPKPVGDVIRTCANIESAARLLGYRPGTGLEEGLSRFVEWYMDFRPKLAKSA